MKKYCKPVICVVMALTLMLTFVMPGYALALSGSVAAGVALILAMMTVSGIQLLSGNKVDVAKEIYTDIHNGIEWLGDVVAGAIDISTPVVEMTKNQIIEITNAIKTWIQNKSEMTYEYDIDGEINNVNFEMNKIEGGYNIRWIANEDYNEYYVSGENYGNGGIKQKEIKITSISNHNLKVIVEITRMINTDYLEIYFKNYSLTKGKTDMIDSVGIYEDALISGKLIDSNRCVIYSKSTVTGDRWVSYRVRVGLKEIVDEDESELISGEIYTPMVGNILDGIEGDTVDITLPVNPANTYAQSLDNVDAITGVVSEIPDIDVDMPDIDALKLPNLITTKFPFSIPFDVARAFNVMVSAPMPPVFVVPVKIDSAGVDESVEIDLAEFEPLAKISRWFSLTIVVFGLILATRKLIGQ